MPGDKPIRNKLIENQYFQEGFPMLGSGFQGLSVGLAFHITKCAVTNLRQESFRWDAL